MPLVRLLIFLFRGVGSMFRAVGRFLRALVGAGMRGFARKCFEASLRLGFLASLVAVCAVGVNLFRHRPYAADGYGAVGPVQVYSRQEYPSFSDFQRLTVRQLLTDFAPKDAKCVYGPGKLDVDGIIQVWKTEEMVHVSGQKVTWRSEGDGRGRLVSKLVLKEEDFAPNDWSPFESCFQQAWGILVLPLMLGFLVFPGSARFRERLYRMCVFAPVNAVVSFSFAYLFALYWLRVQYEVFAPLVLDLPRWSPSASVLGDSLVAGAVLSLLPVTLWYLLRWVLGPFLGATTPQAPAP